jgi:hypothetical protein
MLALLAAASAVPQPRGRRPRALLHVGPWKTGTTHIQHTMSEHRRELRRNGMVLAHSGWAHRQPGFVYMWGLDLSSRHSKGWAPPPILRIRNITRAQLRAEGAATEEFVRDAASRGLDVFLSYEGFSALSKPGLRELRLALSGFDVVAVAFFRNLVSRTISLYLQRTKGSQTPHVPLSRHVHGVLWALRENSSSHHALDTPHFYSEMLDRLQSVFGKVRLLPYEAPGDIANRMLAGAGFTSLALPGTAAGAIDVPGRAGQREGAGANASATSRDGASLNVGVRDSAVRQAFGLYREWAAATHGCIPTVSNPATADFAALDALQPLASLARTKCFSWPLLIDAATREFDSLVRFDAQRPAAVAAMHASLPWCELDRNATLRAGDVCRVFQHTFGRAQADEGRHLQCIRTTPRRSSVADDVQRCLPGGGSRPLTPDATGPRLPLAKARRESGSGATALGCEPPESGAGVLVSWPSKLAIFYAGKAGATAAAQLMFQRLDLTAAAAAFHPWVHEYRTKVYEKSASGTTRNFTCAACRQLLTCIWIVRQPLDRVVSSFLATVAVRDSRDPILSGFTELARVRRGQPLGESSFRDFVAALELRAQRQQGSRRAGGSPLRSRSNDAARGAWPRTPKDLHFLPQAKLWRPRCNISHIYFAPVEALGAAVAAISKSSETALDARSLSGSTHYHKTSQLPVADASSLPATGLRSRLPAYTAFLTNASLRHSVCRLFRHDFAMYLAACQQEWLLRDTVVLAVCRVEAQRIREGCGRQIGVLRRSANHAAYCGAYT